MATISERMRSTMNSAAIRWRSSTICSQSGSPPSASIRICRAKQVNGFLPEIISKIAIIFIANDMIELVTRKFSFVYVLQRDCTRGFFYTDPGNCLACTTTRSRSVEASGQGLASTKVRVPDPGLSGIWVRPW